MSRTLWYTEFAKGSIWGFDDSESPALLRSSPFQGPQKSENQGFPPDVGRGNRLLRAPAGIEPHADSTAGFAARVWEFVPIHRPLHPNSGAAPLADIHRQLVSAGPPLPDNVRLVTAAVAAAEGAEPIVGNPEGGASRQFAQRVRIPPALLTGDASHFAWAFKAGVGPKGWNDAGAARSRVSLERLRAFANAYPEVKLITDMKWQLSNLSAAEVE